MLRPSSRMISGLALLTGGLPLAALAGCDALRVPHVVLEIHDPEGLATRAATLEVGRSLDALEAVPVEDEGAFPATLTVTAAEEERGTVWVQARAADGALLARGSAEVELLRTLRSPTDVDLAQPCDEGDHEACDDGSFCTGEERCRDRVCVRGDEPCAPSPFSCVVVSCVEELESCDVQVSHNVCDPDGTAIEPTYCDVTEGCRPGAPCYEDADCGDSAFCNGEERCLAGRCVGGDPPALDDGNPCTVSGCSEEDDETFVIALGLGTPCALPGAQGLGVCLEAACVPSTCGDGFTDEEEGEACDDGNLNDLDACRTDCQRNRWEVTKVTGAGMCDGQSLPEVALGTLSHIAAAPDGTLVWADEDHHVIRRYDPTTGLVTRVAGTGATAYAPEGTPALEAPLRGPSQVAVHQDSGRVYFREGSSEQARILFIDDDGRLVAVAGTGDAGGGSSPDARATSFVNPHSLVALGNELVFVAGWSSEQVWSVDVSDPAFFPRTLIGGGGEGAAGTATAYDTSSTRSIQAVGPDELVVAQGGSGSAALRHRLSTWTRQLDGSWAVTPLAGNGSCDAFVDGADAAAATLCDPRQLVEGALGDAWCALVDTPAHRVVCLGLDGKVHLRVGTGTIGTPADGQDPLAADLGYPEWQVGGADGALYVKGRASQYGTRYLLRVEPDRSSVSIVAGGEGTTPSACGLGGPADLGIAAWPDDVGVLPDGTLLLQGNYNQQFEVTPAGTLADGSVPGIDLFQVTPFGAVVGRGDSGRLYLRDATTGEVDFVAGGGSSLDDGAQGGEVRTVEVVDFDMPDPDTLIYLERSGQRLRQLVRTDGPTPDAPVWTVSTLAGTGFPSPETPAGPALSTALSFPRALALDAGGVPYLVDNGTRLRRLQDGQLEDVARLAAPVSGLAFDSAGNLLVTSRAAHRLWMLPRQADGTLGPPFVVAGSGEANVREGEGAEAALADPTRVAVGPDGSMYVLLESAHQVVVVRRVEGGP